MNSQVPPESEPGPRSAKRRRIQIACIQCRDRKTRCDGARPVCGTCGRRGKAGACTYDQDGPPTLQHVREVEDRLKRLEARTHEQISPVGPVAALDTEKSLPIAAKDILASDHGRFDVFSRNFEESTPSTSLSYSSQSTRDMHMATEPGVSYRQNFTRAAEPKSLSSSNQRFVQSLDTGWSMPLHNNRSAHRLPPIPRFLWKRLDSSAMIPHRSMADSLLHSFFNFAHEFLPIFHKPIFEERYEKLWTSSVLSKPHTPHEKLEDDVFLSTLNVCFALGSLFSPMIPDEDRDTTSDEYYERSRTLINFDVRDYSSLSTVRLQLVTGLYLQTTSYSTRCWNVVGTAIRLAQDLELHKDLSGYEQADQVNVEMKRRVWHSCVTMDILLASIYGRPPMVSRTCNVQLPSDVDQEYHTADLDGNISRGLIPGASMFRLSVKLLNVLHGILETIYLNFQPQPTDRPGSRDVELIGKILGLNHQLDGFLASVPERLSGFITLATSSGRGRACDFSMHEQALIARFLYARIMLLRPLMLVIGNSNHYSSVNLEVAVSRECCSLCLVSAEILVLNLHQGGSTSHRLADWHTTYLLFTATTVFLAVVRHRLLPGKELHQRFGVFRKHCVGIISSTDMRNTLVTQLESLLSFLHNALCQNDQDAHGNTPTCTSESGNSFHLTANSNIGAYDNDIAPPAVAASDVWDNFDFGQILDQQFLDPSWLEEIQV